MRWFTADTHFGHKNAIKFGRRPWSSVEDMNEGLIANWNSRVSSNDEVWVLGDFAFRSATSIGHIFHRLKGKKLLVTGNHDGKDVMALPWTGIFDYKAISEHGHNVILFHYPIRSWNKMFRGSYHFHGHEHGNVVNYSHYKNSVGKGGSCDVGVDCWDWYPVSFEEIVERIEKSGHPNPDLYNLDGTDRTIRRKEDVANQSDDRINE